MGVGKMRAWISRNQELIQGMGGRARVGKECSRGVDVSGGGRARRV